MKSFLLSMIFIYIYYIDLQHYDLMKVKPFKEEIICLVLDFLDNDLGQSEIASQLRQKYLSNTLPQWVTNSNILIQKGLVKAVKNYVQLNKKVKEYYVNRQQPKEEESQEEEPKPRKQKKIDKESVEKKRKLSAQSIKSKKSKTEKNHWMNSKFAPPVRLEDIEDKSDENEINGEQIQEEKPKTTQKKMQTNGKKKQVVSSDESSSSEEEVIVKKPKKTIIKEKNEEKKKPIQKQENKIIINKKSNQNQNGGKPFSRINAEEVGDIKKQLQDNTFEAKFKYGKGDEWGKFGYQKLKDTRGDSFKKTKGKLKNRAFQASNVDFNSINSVSLL